jgi:hypothetical protein
VVVLLGVYPVRPAWFVHPVAISDTRRFCVEKAFLAVE